VTSSCRPDYASPHDANASTDEVIDAAARMGLAGPCRYAIVRRWVRHSHPPNTACCSSTRR
jgi:hypothetical protein